MAKCSVGKYLKSIGERKTIETCKKKNYAGITKVADLSAHEQSQLQLRTGKSNLDTICGFHKEAYFEKFNELFGSICCDPFKHHILPKRLSISQRIPLTVQHRATAPQHNLVPGKSLCKPCYQEVFRGKRVPKAKSKASMSKLKKKKSFGRKSAGARRKDGMLNILSRMFRSDSSFDEESASEAELEDSEYLLDSLKDQNEADDIDADADDENMGVAETYADYMPSKLNIGVKHPDPVVETASLSSVEPTDVWYNLSIPSNTIYSGALSALQLEAITYASQQHEKFLPDGSRAGFLIGDGAGVGKGRTIAGAIFENFLKGRKRSIWVSVSNDLKYDAERDLLDIGAGSKIDVHCLNKFKYADIASVTNKKVKNGVIFSTYSALIGRTNQSKTKYNTRLSQLLDWCGSDFDGIIVFDECHRAKNLVPAAGTKPTRTGQTVLELQQKLPKARVIYASATGASEPRNMAYMIRLGMWGEGTPFAEFGDFIDSIEKRGVGAMEIVAMDMKLRGTYIARQLSFQGVTFRIEDVPLSDECVQIYNDSVHLWVEAVNMFTEAIVLLRSTKKPVMRMIWCQFWAAHQRFFKYLCIAFKVKRAVEITREAVKEGKCVVIGLQSTGEARTLAQLEKDDGELTDFVSSAKGVLENLVEKNFPAPGAPVIGKGKRSNSSFKKTPKSAMKTPKIESSTTKNVRTPGNYVVSGQKRKPLREAAVRAFKKVKIMIESHSDSNDAEVKMEHSGDENCPPVIKDRDCLMVPKANVKNPARDSGIQMSEDESFGNKSSFLAIMNDDDNKDSILADLDDNDKKDSVIADLDDDEDVWSEGSDEESSDSDTTTKDEKCDSEESDSDLSDSDVSEAEESDREDSDDSYTTSRVSKKKSSFGSAGSSTEPGSKKKTIQDRLDEILQTCRADRSEHSAQVLKAIDKTQKMKQELIEKIEKLGQRLPPATLDELINELGGPKNVAEMTGRKGRVVSTPGGGVLYESRAEGDTPLETLNLAEKQMFMDGDKIIAIISEAASSGISLQSDRRAKNKKRRVHITLELPWSADRAIQQFGRTHRSNQVNAPEYIFMISDLAGERRFASIVAKRLESLGALTHADRRATETRDLSQYNMDNKYGHAALKKTGRIIMGKDRPLVPLPKDYNGDFLKDVKDALIGVGLVINLEDEFGNLVLDLVKDFHNISKFLNRILGLPVELQNRLFKYFTDILGRIIAAAKKAGTFDLGILDLGTVGDDVKRVHQYNFLRKHATGQATTELHTVHVQRGLPWQAAVSKWCELTGLDEGFYLLKKIRSGRQPTVLAIATGARVPYVDENGAMSLKPLMTLYRPHTGMQMKRELLPEIQRRFKKVTKDEAEPSWVEQYEASENTCSHAYWNGFCKFKAVSGKCEYGLRRRTYTVLSGSVLAVWDKVEKVLKSRFVNAKMQVIRLKTVDGSKLVGALIPNSCVGPLRAVLSENAEDTSEKTF